MRDTCDELFIKQHIQLRKLFIPLFIESDYRYCFNILSISILLYYLYDEHEIYHMAYNKIINRPTDNLFIEVTISN